MKIQNTTAAGINIKADLIDAIDKRIQYTVEGTWADIDTLEALFPQFKFTIAGDKVKTQTIVWCPQLSDIFNVFTIQASEVGETITKATAEMGTKILFQTNVLGLPVDEQGVIVGWSLV